jgi:hypothetical protein
MGQKSKHIFILDKAYKNFIPGRSGVIRSSFGFDKMRLKDWGCLIFGLPFWWLMIFTMLWILLPIPFNPERFGVQYQPTFAWWVGFGFYVLFVAATLYMIYIGVFALFRTFKDIVDVWHYRKLRKQGNVIMGEIIHIEREEKDGFYGAHNVIVTYQFETPDGRLLTRTMKKERHDLRNKELPGKGTAVMVLYADDSAVMML